MATEWPRFREADAAAGGPELPQRQIKFLALRAILRLMALVINGARGAFEQGRGDDVLNARAGSHFTQRLLHRMSTAVTSIVERQ